MIPAAPAFEKWSGLRKIASLSPWIVFIAQKVEGPEPQKSKISLPKIADALPVRRTSVSSQGMDQEGKRRAAYTAELRQEDRDFV